MREVKRSELVDLVSKLTDEYTKDRNTLGVSLAMPGIIDVNLGVVIYSAAFELKELELKRTLRKKTGKDFFIMNDANAATAAFSHRWKNLEYFLISIPHQLERPVRIGLGLWLEGKSYLGSTMSAGEFKVGTLPPLVDNSSKYKTLKDIKRHELLKLSEIQDFLNILISNI